MYQKENKIFIFLVILQNSTKIRAAGDNEEIEGLRSRLPQTDIFDDLSMNLGINFSINY